MKEKRMVGMELPLTSRELQINKPNSSNSVLNSRVLIKILAQAMVLATLITVLPWLRDQYLSTSPKNISKNVNDGSLEMDSLPLLFHDLANEGLLRTNDKAIIAGKEEELAALREWQILKNTQIDMVNQPEVEAQNNFLDETFDLALATNELNGFIDRTLKLGGIVVVQYVNQDLSLSSSSLSSASFDKPSNYKIIHFRRFGEVTFVSMRKMSYSEPNSNSDSDSDSSSELGIRPRSPTQRKLMRFTPEEKNAALKDLEDVLLEPPRSATGTSKTYLKKTKYLPNLLNDPLESYPRRVFIDVGSSKKLDESTHWFQTQYPTRNKKFEMYRIETVTPLAEEEEEEMEMSDWMRRNVKEDEFVVMKAEDDLVEEMVKSNAIKLVDELFMECKPMGKGGRSRRIRAYWECLALYGKLRDLGVAVHQWWG